MGSQLGLQELLTASGTAELCFSRLCFSRLCCGQDSTHTQENIHFQHILECQLLQLTCATQSSTWQTVQSFLFVFLRQGPLLVLIPHGTGVAAPVPPILQGGQNLALYCIFLLLFLTISRFQELSEGDAKMGEIQELQKFTGCRGTRGCSAMWECSLQISASRAG